MSRAILITVVLIFLGFLAGCSVETREIKSSEQSLDPVVTFIELGSVRCIPCKNMQPVMASIEMKYRGQVEVIFYDVLEEDQKQFASQYGIKLIPTQVFLDSTGAELMRHEGYLPEAEIDSFLARLGLSPNGAAG